MREIECTDLRAITGLSFWKGLLENSEHMQIVRSEVYQTGLSFWKGLLENSEHMQIVRSEVYQTVYSYSEPARHLGVLG